jgi:hypothetical protein
MVAAPLLAATGGRGLLTLPGDWAPTRYAPGALDRAANVQERFELLAASFARWSDRRISVPLLLVAPEDWAAGEFGVPFGLPAATAARELALPAWGDASTVALWSGLLGAAELEPSLPGGDEAGAAEPVRGTRAEAGSLGLADVTGQLEAARLLVAGTGLDFAPSGCVEVMAALVARAAFGRFEADRLPELRELFGRLAARIEGAMAPTEIRAADPERRLAAWGRLYLVADAAVGEREASDPAKALLRKAAKRRGPLLLAEVWDRLPEGRAVFVRSFGAQPEPPAGRTMR